MVTGTICLLFVLAPQLAPILAVLILVVSDLVGIEPPVFAALVPNSAEKSLKEVMEEIMGDHEMMDFAFVDDDVDGGWTVVKILNGGESTKSDDNDHDMSSRGGPYKF
ncbi:hypothetical protein POM88_051939 [Heracleum sosnowskyi]|uniref:Uncharacterized protein n=1 Tax=Heracleum sosnowskyi TaxID=360622 RepID=A0AAD8GS92_9APIA|nr:hypothetical protein POM88_051939 [Heracleum sosnowskyi]